MEEKVKKSFYISVGLSILLHILFAGGLRVFEDDLSSHNETPVEIVILDLRQDPDPDLKQVVEQAKKAINDEVSEDAKFLGRHNQKVVRETRAAKTGAFKNTGQQGQQGKSQQAQEKPKSSSKRRAMIGSLPTIRDLKPSFDAFPKTDTKSYKPKAGAQSQTDDYLKDVETGVQTLLNTREFVYYSYYERIRHQIRQYWEPSIREKVRKLFARGRSIASTRDRVTGLDP